MGMFQIAENSTFKSEALTQTCLKSCNLLL